MEDPKPPPGLAATQAATETPDASHSPPAGQDLRPPSAEADEDAPPPPPLTETEAHPPPANADEAPPLPASAYDEAPQPPPPPPVAKDPPPPPEAAAQPPPPPVSAAQLPTPPQTATVDPPARGRKRPLECNFQIENSKYFKMRLILRDLRPHFLEVLRTPDFRNCNAAKEIQEKMKLMLELYQQMTGETAKRENAPKSQSLPNGNVINQTPQHTSLKSSEMWSFQTGNLSEKHQSEVGDNVGGPVVGGSAFGWNYITYGGTEPVYYGTTKEEYRSSHPITEGE